MAFERLHSAVADATFSSTGATNWNANQTPSGADVGGIPYCPTATTETTASNFTFDGTTFSAPRATLAAGTLTTDVRPLTLTATWNAAGVAFTGLKYTITDTASAAGSLAMQILGGASGTTNLASISKGGSLVLLGDITHTNASAGAFTISSGSAVGDILQLSAPGSAVLDLSTGGGVRIRQTGDAFSMRSATNLVWAVGTTVTVGNDTNISKISPGLVGVGTGAAGSFAGSLKAAAYIGQSYTLHAACGAFNPTDGQTVYAGLQNLAAQTTAAIGVVPIPVTGTIVRVDFEVAVFGTLGDAATATAYIRYNNTTDLTISATVAFTAARQAYSATLSQAVTAGDYFQIKVAQPTWNTTNPTQVIYMAVVTVQTT